MALYTRMGTSGALFGFATHLLVMQLPVFFLMNGFETKIRLSQRLLSL